MGFCELYNTCNENLPIGQEFLIRISCEMNTKETSNFPLAEIIWS